MQEWMKHVEPIVYKSRIKVPYNWSVGEIGSTFLVTLRDHMKLLGRKCLQCSRVYIPPRKMCHHCFRDTDEWVEVGPEGTLRSYTVVRYEHKIHPLKAPFGYGLIELDGSSTALLHLLYECDWNTIRSGMRVAPVFKDHRSGHILDISYFRPV